MALSETIAALLDQELVGLRDGHARAYRAHGVPTPRNEDWKYTNLRRLETMEFRRPDTEPNALTPGDLTELGIPGFEGWRFTLVDGRFVPELSFLDGMPDCIRPLGDSLEAAPEWLQDTLSRPFEQQGESLAALNGALMGDGVILDLADGVRLERPIELLQISLESERAALINTRHVVRLGAGASARIVEQHVALGPAKNLTSCVTQVDLGRDAQFDHVRIQREAQEAFLISRTVVDQAEDSRYSYWGFDLGGSLARHDIQSSLNGEGSECHLNGVYALDGKRHVDYHTRVDHRTPNATSSEFFKGVVDGQSRGVFNGKVVVHEGADGTDAQQTNANLLLSRQAEVDTKPELEIYADDVQCAHGATVGELDEKQLFYLRSRGIPESEARLLLTYAFCREVVDTLDDESLREFIASQVILHLPRSEALEDVA